MLGIPAKKKKYAFERGNKWDIYFILLLIYVCFHIMKSHTKITPPQKKMVGVEEEKKKSEKEHFISWEGWKWKNSLDVVKCCFP